MKDFFRKLELPEFIKDSRLSSSVLIVIFLSLFSAVVGVMISPFFGLAMVLIFVLIVAFTVYGAYILAGNANNFAANLSYRIKRSEQEAMIKMPLGILLYDSDHHIQWVNPYLQMYLDDEDILGRSISSVDPELGKIFETILSSKKTSQNQLVKWGNRQFEIIVQDNLGVIYLLDITRYAQIEEKYEAERLAIGLIFIDNYDELSQGMHDQELALMSSYVQNTLSEYAVKFHSYLKRIDEDHFLLLAHMQDLKKLEGDKFSVLDKVRLETSRNNTPLTLSVGLASEIKLSYVNQVRKRVSLEENLIQWRNGRGFVREWFPRPCKRFLKMQIKYL